MDVLADENVESEWISALRDDGHDVKRVVDVSELGVGTPDPDVLAVATRIERTVLTADQSDFHDPPSDDHAGVVIIADVTRSGGEVRRAVRRIERSYPDLAGKVAYVSDWLWSGHCVRSSSFDIATSADAPRPLKPVRPHRSDA